MKQTKVVRYCVCGQKMTIKQIRVHIALLTPGWPRVRCDKQHYDPMSNEDCEYIKRKAELPLHSLGRSGFACD